jgi:2-polyprenyl-6-methoxyphenol hydroxylase-like FAD-dependent oxidoreductase
MRGLNTSYPHLTTLPQWKLESILLSRLSVKAERPVKLLSYVQESDHVVAKIQHGDDESNVEEVRARYIIGSDGVHSTVRKGMSDWTFLGTVFNVPFGLADVTLTGEKIPDERYFSFIQSKHGALGIIPMFDEDRNKFIARLVLSLGDNAHGTGPADHKDTEDNISYGISTTEPFTMEELQTLIDQRSGIFKFKAEEPLWLTRFGVNERKANGFRRGRAFIMGGRVSIPLCHWCICVYKWN